MNLGQGLQSRRSGACQEMRPVSSAPVGTARPPQPFQQRQHQVMAQARAAARVLGREAREGPVGQTC